MDAGPELIHATAIAVAGNAVVIRGPSGSGKSDLALRCLALPPSPLWPGGPALLVSDDQVALSVSDGVVYADAPTSIRGRIEVRGLGIRSVPTAGRIAVRLVADLTDPHQIERMPLQLEHEILLGTAIPRLRIAPFQASAPIKLLMRLTDCSGCSY